MKVGFITRHAVANYGSILQSYAMQETIKGLGYESEIINYIRNDEKGRNIGKTMLNRSKFWNKNLITRFAYNILQTPNYTNSFNRFSEFRRELLKETREYNSLEQLKMDCPNEDAYCTGSDQVWGKIGDDDFDKAYFLDFVPDDKKCISYASSFGKEKINKRLEQNLPELLKKYNKVLVREDSAVKLLRDKGISCEQTIDPVYLLDKEQWNKMIGNTKYRKKYILVYQLHNNKKFEKYCKEFSKKVKLPLIRISISWLYIVRPGKLVFLPTPQEFMAYFRDAEYVITDSFHGTSFSLIFNKKFIDILPSDTSTRITSILNLTGTQDRILNNYNDFEIIKKDIDYKKVNGIIEKERQNSIRLLKEAIEN